MEIPLHNFSQDDETSIPFEIIPLKQQSEYDTGVPHRHNYYEIFFFEEGGGNHTIDFSNVPVESHSIHFVSPGQVHHLSRSLASHGAIILFSRDFYYLGLQEKNLLFEMPFLNNAMENPVLNLSQAEFKQCFQIVKAMSVEAQSEESYSRHQLRSYLNIMMVTCKRFFESQSEPSNVRALKHPLFNKFRRVLEENFSKLHQVQDYPDLLGLSEKQLNELVKNLTGTSVLEHIHSRLVLESKRLLMYSELSQKEIGFQLGFEDPSHFSRFFKSKAGFSPSTYRDQEELMYQY